MKSGESKWAAFTLSLRQLSMINDQSKRMIEEGVFVVHVGGKQPGFTGGTDTESTAEVGGKFYVDGNM